ncbi:hypothetical protein Cfor_06905 [Coptotermes formosanus]|uniref:Prokineticin domain-containing protein n=1 Tax=Coptotermes formosanus TaxID=36987 RepID=A0A6L2PA39_COPFO|nr:hypothetical protein Cfor_06905 [Coptotermes formosanus]
MVQLRLVVVLMLASVAYLQTTDRPPWYEGCLNNDECAATQCCVLGGNAYSIAGCENLLGPGNACRPNNEPINASVTYPNGDRVDLTNVYYTVCNCAQGLRCIEGICKPDVLMDKPQH